MNTRIQKFMTATPHTIGQEQPLTTAHQIMREYRVRHLPVLHGGKLVGVLSHRDLDLLETLQGLDPKTTKVEEAMTADVYVIGPDAELDDVAAHMAEHKYGSAVIVDRGKVIGLFTTTDALAALARFTHQVDGTKKSAAGSSALRVSDPKERLWVRKERRSG